MSSAEILTILEHYKYILIFPTAVIEGPIVSILSGFLVHLGYLSFFLVYITLLLSDTVGCTLYYMAGKFWRKWVWIKKYATWFGYNEGTEEYLENHFKKHKFKTIFIAKISHGLGGLASISAGVAGVNYLEFIIFNILIAIPKTLILMLVGYYVGSSYQQIDGYLSHISLTVLVIALFVLAYLSLGKTVKNFWKRDETL